MTLNIFKFFLLACLLSFCCQVNAQDYGADSLHNYTYLFNQYKKNLAKQDVENARKYAIRYYKKANLEDRGTEKEANGHYYLAMISEADNMIAHLDTTIAISKKFENNKFFPGMAYFQKAGWYYDKEDFNKALDNYILSLAAAQKSKYHYLEIMSKNTIGIIKLERIGQEREAITLFRECEKYYDTVNGLDQLSYDYLALISSLSIGYSRLELLDSSSYYNQKGILASQKYENSYYKEHFKFIEAVNEYGRGHLEKAMTMIQEVRIAVEGEMDYSTLQLMHYYLGMIFQKQGEEKKAIAHFITMDSLHNFYPIYTSETRNGIEQLIKHHQKKEDLQLELTYVKKLLSLDSIYMNDFKTISTVMNSEYDNKNLIAQRDTLTKKLAVTTTFSKTKTFILIALLGLFLVTLLYFYKKQRRLKMQFDRVVNHIEKPTKEKDSENKDIGISDDIISAILENLEAFEKEEGYLQKDLNSQQLAKLLQTNTKYLSKVVNREKGKSLVNYINDLRVDYAIEMLKNDSKFKFYTISSIAEEVGFSNSTSFAQCFYKRTDLKPSFFIKQLIRSANS